ncbi:MAG: type II secretion system F family protein [Lachnospiraceae bacterium]|nr:type II secretion system F family protein [Lachnospiraceae bacterium]
MKNRERQQYLAAKKLYGNRAEEYLRQFVRKKRIAVVITVVTALLLAALTAIRQSGDTELIRGRYIERNEKDGADKIVRVEAYAANGYRKSMQLQVAEQQYTEKELEDLWDTFTQVLPETIFAEGDSQDYVSKDMNLPSRLTGYPFTLEWQSDAPLILSGDGKIREERLQDNEAKKNGICVTLTVTAKYGEYMEEYSIPVRVFGRYLTKEELFWQQVETAIDEWNSRSTTGKYQQLPDRVEDTQIVYREEKSTLWLFVLLCGLAAAFLLTRHFDDALQEQVKKRDEQLEAEYPQLVNRFVLYYGAGLTIKNIWQRICMDYRERKKTTGINCAYEEMMKADKQMQDGVGESEAYAEFAASVALTRYRNLIGLLQQALQSGGSDIREQLNEQLREAFSEQKRQARIRGEKAGTKLLLPMFLMLTVVLIVILVPAFLSF